MNYEYYYKWSMNTTVRSHLRFGCFVVISSCGDVTGVTGLDETISVGVVYFHFPYSC